MISLDTTIANVALPHIQGSVSASQDEITWMLTSYIVATAIVTPLTGWLVAQLGRKQLMLWAIAGFTVASGLCGVATDLYELVAFRLLQGAFGATLVPLSQATLLDINPKERHGQAMATWSMGVILGPVIGPVLGGWLTDRFSWRWVFFINLPIGALTMMGLSASLSRNRNGASPRLDFFGFSLLSLTVGSLQLLLDRGQTKDWLHSREICIEGAATLFFGYLTAVHTLTAKRPFINTALFSDRNFVVGSTLGFFIGPILFGVLALLPPMLESLLGYPVTFAGIAMAPRGFGTLLAMTLMGRLLKHIDARLFIFVGFLLTGGRCTE
jgi:DHA2 family multidrug resistance protein